MTMVNPAHGRQPVFAHTVTARAEGLRELVTIVGTKTKGE